MTAQRMPAHVLLLIGDQAEVTTPHRDHTDPERVPVDRLVRNTGIPRAQLAGADLVAIVGEDGTLVRFERA